MYDKNLRELEIRMVGAGVAADLISSRQVRQALRVLIRKIKEGGDLKYDETYLTEFLGAARKELKIANQMTYAVPLGGNSAR